MNPVTGIKQVVEKFCTGSWLMLSTLWWDERSWDEDSLCWFDRRGYEKIRAVVGVLNPTASDVEVTRINFNTNELPPQLGASHSGCAAPHERVKNCLTDVSCASYQPTGVAFGLWARMTVVIKAAWRGKMVVHGLERKAPR